MQRTHGKSISQVCIRVRFDHCHSLTQLLFTVSCVHRWADGTEPRYTNWSQPPSDSGINANSRDCVIFAANGWRLHSMTCGIAEFPFVCKMNRECIIELDMILVRQEVYTLSTNVR